MPSTYSVIWSKWLSSSFFFFFNILYCLVFSLTCLLAVRNHNLASGRFQLFASVPHSARSCLLLFLFLILFTFALICICTMSKFWHDWTSSPGRLLTEAKFQEKNWSSKKVKHFLDHLSSLLFWKLRRPSLHTQFPINKKTIQHFAGHTHTYGWQCQLDTCVTFD